MFKYSDGNTPVSVSQLFSKEYAILEIMLVFMHQLEQLKQAKELTAIGGYTFGTTFHKQLT